MNELGDARVETLAQRLAAAHANVALLELGDGVPVPADAQAAYAIQHRVLALRHRAIGGWKVGAKSPDGPIQGSPLPADRVLVGDAACVSRRRYATIGLELEIALRFGRRFEPRPEPYAEAEVLAGVAAMMATIEIVSTRYAGWPAVDKLAQLADFQNHGALAVGAEVPYAPDYPFLAPQARFEFAGLDIVADPPPANPAGDPRRLLAWLVNHARGRGIAITPEMLVTTGSYTGMYFADGPGVAFGAFEGLPPVALTLA